MKKPMTEEQRARVREQSRRWYHANKEKQREKRLAWQRANPDKTLAATKRWQAANPEKVKAGKRAWRAANSERLKPVRRRHGLATYGLTPEHYDLMLKGQGGVCAICRLPPAGSRRLAVDHCHNSSKVRGLLCASCNNGLGRFKDSPELLREAAMYLELRNEP